MGGGNSPNADGQFVKAPIFNFNDDKLKFNTNDVDNANENYGSVSGFLPKSLPQKKRMPSRKVYGWAFSSLLCGSYPSADLSTDLIDDYLDREILFRVDCFRLFHEPDEYTKEIQFYARAFKD